jgi:CO/xanthine dehydrogenase FAD-binding subunit
MDALPEFTVLNPATLEEAIAARAAHPGSKPLGGGTDLVVIFAAASWRRRC